MLRKIAEAREVIEAREGRSKLGCWEYMLGRVGGRRGIESGLEIAV